MPDPVWEHLTPKGLFRITEVRIDRGAAVYKLWLDNLCLGTVTHPDSGARQLNDGLFDEKLGFSAKTLSIPRRVDQWRPHWRLGPSGIES